MNQEITKEIFFQIRREAASAAPPPTNPLTYSSNLKNWRGFEILMMCRWKLQIIGMMDL